MIDILSQANSAIVGGVTAGAGVIVAFGLTIKHITNRKIHLNGKQYVSEELFEERTENIKESLERIETKLDELNK